MKILFPAPPGATPNPDAPTQGLSGPQETDQQERQVHSQGRGLGQAKLSKAPSPGQQSRRMRPQDVAPPGDDVLSGAESGSRC